MSPKTARLRKDSPLSWRLLVAVEYGPKDPVADVLDEASRLRELKDAFLQEFTADHSYAAFQGPRIYLRANGLAIHLWLEHERYPNTGPDGDFFGDSDHQKMTAFFHKHGIDVVPYR